MPARASWQDIWTGWKREGSHSSSRRSTAGCASWRSGNCGIRCGFGRRWTRCATVRGGIAKRVRKALEWLLPEQGLAYRVVHRVAGLGSLGRERYVALASWRGGKVAREAKALVPSACAWANGSKGSKKILYESIITSAVRVPDPFVHLRGSWIVRRLAPDCSRVELSSLPKKRDEARLLRAMGFETANVHWGSKRAIKAVRRDLARRRPDWLHAAVKAMAKAVARDWEEWRQS